MLGPGCHKEKVCCPVPHCCLHWPVLTPNLLFLHLYSSRKLKLFFLGVAVPLPLPSESQFESSLDVAVGWLLKHLKELIHGNNLHCVCLSHAEWSHWRREGGRSSSQGGRRCSDGLCVFSGPRTSLMFQPQRRHCWRKQIVRFWNLI